MGRIIPMACLIAWMSPAACGQDAVTTAAFEVASIRVNKTAMRGGSVDFAKGGERFTATNMPLGALILMAYQVTVRQLSGQLSGLEPSISEKYDIAAKAEHAASPDTMLHMLQALLADRFKLVVHRETREVAVYALTIGKGGPKLHLSDSPQSEGVTPRIPSHAGGIEPKSGQLTFKNESMADFAWALSRTAGIGDRVVVDQTGLKGNYDFELRFERDRVPEAGAGLGEPTAQIEGSSIYSALEEQLGLKLESRKAPVEFLTIDSVERPSGN